MKVRQFNNHSSLANKKVLIRRNSIGNFGGVDAQDSSINGSFTVSKSFNIMDKDYFKKIMKKESGSNFHLGST